MTSVKLLRGNCSVHSALLFKIRANASLENLTCFDEKNPHYLFSMKLKRTLPKAWLSWVRPSPWTVLWKALSLALVVFLVSCPQTLHQISLLTFVEAFLSIDCVLEFRTIHVQLRYWIFIFSPPRSSTTTDDLLFRLFVHCG